jgi:hypothetical protein
MLSDEPLKEFKRVLVTHPKNSLDSLTIQIFPTNAYAKQKIIFDKESGSQKR